MARTSSGGGSRFASSNLNDLYGKHPGIISSSSGGGGKSRYGGSSSSGGSSTHHHHHGGMLILARVGRSSSSGGGSGKSVKQSKLTVPAPVNLPSLRKEHAGNDPNVNLVGAGSSAGGIAGWSKQQIQIQQQQQQQDHHHPHPQPESQIRGGNGWNQNPSPSLNAQQAEVVSSTSTRPGKYTPPAARGGGGTGLVNPVTHPVGPASSSVLLRGEDFPTLQAAAPFPVPPQQRLRDMQQRQKERVKQQKLQQLSQNQQEVVDEGLPVSTTAGPPLALSLQPQSSSKQREEQMMAPQRNAYLPFKENRKPPNDLSLRPGPLLHLSHTSNWAEDERETSVPSSKAPEWEDGPRYYGQTGGGGGGGGFTSRMPAPTGYRAYNNSREFERSETWSFDQQQQQRSGSGWGRERDNYPYTNFLHDNFGRESTYHKSGGGDHRGRFGGARNGAFDLPVRVRSPYTEDAFMREFPELSGLDFRSKLRRRRSDANEGSYRDLERESFETELERVQKEQEQERQRRIEERERAIEVARKEQEERERVVREEEELQRRIEEEAREAAARAEQEAYESVRRAEESKRAREDEKRKMLEEEETRKVNARRKLLELEERMALRGQRDHRDHVDNPDAHNPDAHHPVMRFEEDDERGPPRYPSPRVQQQHDPRVRSGDVLRNESLRRDRDDRWMANGDPLRSMHSPRMNVESPLMDEERRWSRRSKDGRPFSPPSPGSYDDGFSYGRLRQSLPKQPRVPPPPSRSHVQRSSSSVFSRSQATSHEDTELATESKAVPFITVEDVERVSTPETDDTGSCVVDEKAVDSFRRDDFPDEQVSGDEQEIKELEVSQGSAESSGEEASEIVETVEVVPLSEQESVFTVGGLQETEFQANEETFEIEKVVDKTVVEHVTGLTAELADAPVVLQRVEAGETTIQVEVVVPVITDEEPREKEEKIVEHEGTQAAQTFDLAAFSRPLLPSPFQTTQPPLNGMHQSFHPPTFMPFDPRPRMQGPHSDRPMTLQFGLLPGTSLLQGSIPAIQIGSIQMPLQLHPPIGHPVAHLQPPPQFQFGQIGQQAPLLPFTVHPQAMLQPSMLNMDGPVQQFRMQPHPDRTFWAGHYVPRKNAAKVDEKAKEEVQHPSEDEKSRHSVDMGPSFEEAPRAAQGSSSAAEPSEEDDFIEVRSKRQLLNDRREQKEKVKSKPKYMKAKEQVAKQKHALKSSQIVSSKEPGKKDTATLRNVSLDVVVTTARSRQVSLSNPEVGFEKRTKSPQPQINSLVSDAPAFPSIVAEGQSSSQANGPVAWGFNRANQEAVGLSHTQLEEAMKPVRFEVPVQQAPLADHLTEVPSSADKGPGPAAAPGPINSLLAGEKIQFGAVTMPAFVSPVPWLGPSRPDGFRKETPDEAEVTSFGKGKRLRESDDGTCGMDSEAEAEAAASAVAVAAISNDDYVHNADQLVPSHGVIGSGSNKGSPAGQSVQASEIDESINVSLPADLSIDMPLRGPPHSGQILPSIPGSFHGMEMGNLLGAERPSAPNWQPHHSAVDSFYGGPHSYAGPFINHGPIPSIPPHTLVYTSPFGGVGQFGQLGVSYMSPAHMPPVKQPDWKHTPASSGGSNGDIGGLGGGIHYAQHNNRHLGHDPSVVPVVPPGPFDVYRDMTFQSQWSGPHPMPGFPMQLRHPHPAYHLPHQQHPIDMMSDSAAAGAPAEFPDELLGDSLSTTSDANSSFVVQQTPSKPSSPVSSLPAGSKLRSRVVQPVAENNGHGSHSRPHSGGSNSSTGFQAHSYVSTVTGARRGAGGGGQQQQQHDKKNLSSQHSLPSKIGGAVASGWANNQQQQQQGRKTGGPGRSQGLGGDKSSNSTTPAGKLKQVYVVKPPATVGLNNSDSCSEMFTADARHM